MDLNELFGEGTLKTLALATAEDAKSHLAAGHPLRAAFSAAHCIQISGQQSWGDDEHGAWRRLSKRMSGALSRGHDRRLARGLQHAHRSSAWSDAGRLARRRRRASGLDASGSRTDLNYYPGETFWTDAELRLMLEAVRDDFVVRLRGGDKLMAADRVVLYKVLAGTLKEVSA
jgi:hypothetical protein